jgi:hypothetical protein
MGVTMSMVKPLEPAKISNATEVEVEGDIRELVCDTPRFAKLKIVRAKWRPAVSTHR